MVHALLLLLLSGTTRACHLSIKCLDSRRRVSGCGAGWRASAGTSIAIEFMCHTTAARDGTAGMICTFHRL